MRVLRLGTTVIDLARREARRGGETVSLTATEAELLGYLADHPGMAVSKDQLLRSVWGYHASVRSRTVDTTLSRLRQKIEEDPSKPAFLQTVRGVGIQLVGARDETSDAAAESPRALVGRDAVREALRAALGSPGWVAVVGPAGVGKTALVHAAVHETVWVEVDELETADEVAGALGRLLQTRDPSPETLASVLGDRVLVLDGADRLDSGAEAWVAGLGGACRIVSTSARIPVGVGRVVRVEPLRPDEAARLLVSHLERLGFPADPVVVEEVVSRSDGLPLELELLAPAVGLLGSDAASITESDRLDEAVRRQLSLLVPADRELLVQLSVFRDTFDIHAVAAVTTRPIPELVGALQRLQRNSLLLGGGRLRLLKRVRGVLTKEDDPRTAELRAGASRALERWAVTLQEQSLIDGTDTLLPHRADLAALMSATDEVETAESLARIWSDLAMLAGPERDFVSDLTRLSHRFPSSTSVWLHMLLLRTSPGRLSRAERERLNALPPSVEALTLQFREAQGARDFERLRGMRGELVELISQAPFATQARYLPAVRVPGDTPEAFRSRMAPLQAEAAARGWKTTDALVRSGEIGVLVRSGRYIEVLDRQSDWVHSDGFMGSQTAFWMGVSAFMTGDADGAERWFAKEAERFPADVLLMRLHTGLAALAKGERDRGEGLVRSALRPGLYPGSRHLGLATLELLGVPDVERTTDPELRELLDASALPADPPQSVQVRLLWRLRFMTPAGTTRHR